jgi:hypothetical protein
MVTCAGVRLRLALQVVELVVADLKAELDVR